MYTKDELKQLKKEFWEGFGVYCSEIPAMKRRKSKFEHGVRTTVVPFHARLRLCYIGNKPQRCFQKI